MRANRAASAFRRERPARRSARWPGRSLCSRRLRGRELSRADAKTDAGEKLHPGELVLESEPLRDGKRPPRSAKQHLPGPVEFRPAGVKYQEAVQPALVECPEIAGLSGVPFGEGDQVAEIRGASWGAPAAWSAR